MGLKMNKSDFNTVLATLNKEYRIYAPKNFKGQGTFSDTDRVRYGEIQSIEEIIFDVKSSFSYKEVILPITQTLFFFTEDEVKEAKMNEEKILIFLRSCDMHAVRRLDEIYLNNGGFEDIYYKKFREKTKFVVMGCAQSFESCFCVDMETNRFDQYDSYIHVEGDVVSFDVKDEELRKLLVELDHNSTEIKPQFVTSNPTRVKIPEKLDLRVVYSPVWEEYSLSLIHI